MSTTLENEVIALAGKHGLALQSPLQFNEQGLDFRIAFAHDLEGTAWVLRIPRRPDVFPKMDYEAKVLAFVAPRLTAKVPDWRVMSRELVAYPRLGERTALSFDPATYAVEWHIDKNAPAFVESLARTLVELHRSPKDEAAAAGLTVLSAAEVRDRFLFEFKKVESGLGMGAELATFCRGWLDDAGLWPVETALVHGDLYAGHVTADVDSSVSGIIDWTEAHVGDAAMDFVGHLAAFGAAGLEELIAAYERLGGKTGPRFQERIEARHRASAIRYGAFALDTGSPEHVAAAKAQLGA